jgi:HTH-type transcriptional regulator / antitoxin HigA
MPWHYTGVLHELVMRGNLSQKEEEYVELLSLLIEAYEHEHYPIRAGSPAEVIKTLMEANNLKQKDLARIFGTESMMSMGKLRSSLSNQSQDAQHELAAT